MRRSNEDKWICAALGNMELLPCTSQNEEYLNNFGKVSDERSFSSAAIYSKNFSG
jgi:hypothetical protein